MPLPGGERGTSHGEIITLQVDQCSEGTAVPALEVTRLIVVNSRRKIASPPPVREPSAGRGPEQADDSPSLGLMPPDFTIAFPKPIALEDGRILTTLACAVRMIGERPEFPCLTAQWEQACEAIGQAAWSKADTHIHLAFMRMQTALMEDVGS